MCTPCSAVNAFLTDPDQVFSRYVIEAGEFTHMKESLDALKKWGAVDAKYNISYDRLWYDGILWEDVRIVTCESGPYGRWKT